MTAHWAADVGGLMDALEIPRAAILGWSMGGQYALACAALIPERVTSTVVVAGAVPLDDEVAFGELNDMDRRLTRLSQHHPHVARTTFAALGRLARHSPATWGHLTARAAVPDEASALDDLHPGIAAAAAEALSHPEGMVEEYRAWVRPWGFAPEEVEGPVVLWQGDHDDLVPMRWAQELAARIPEARLELRAGAGHFLAYAHPAEVLESLRPT